jgi:hypothetical protein
MAKLSWGMVKRDTEVVISTGVSFLVLTSKGTSQATTCLRKGEQVAAQQVFGDHPLQDAQPSG